MLTFGEIREIVADYTGRAGRCHDANATALFAMQTMQYLLFSGSSSAIRKLCILAVKGCISLPPEVEVPLKVRIDNRVGEIWNKWGTFHSAPDVFDRCFPAGEILKEDGDQTPLAFPLPHGGSILGILGNCEESEDAFVIIQGRDPTGREIYTTFNGEQIVGEKFRIKKGQIRYGQVKFGEVTSVLKSQTNGYVNCFAVCPQTKSQQYLANWEPSAETPLYKRFRVVSRDCGPIVHVSMLVRVKLKDNYHDNEITLFDNQLAVLLAAQRLQGEINNDLQVAGFKKQGLEDILEKEGSYKRTPNGPLDVFFPTSGGNVRNII